MFAGTKKSILPCKMISTLREHERSIVYWVAHMFSDPVIKTTFSNLRGVEGSEDIKLDLDWVPLTTLAKLKPLKSIVKSPDEIANLVKASALKLVEIHPDGKFIRRVSPFTASDLTDGFMKIMGYTTAIAHVPFQGVVDLVQISGSLPDNVRVSNVECKGYSMQDATFEVEFKSLKNLISCICNTYKFEGSKIFIYPKFHINSTRLYKFRGKSNKSKIRSVPWLSTSECNRWIKFFLPQILLDLCIDPHLYLEKLSKVSPLNSIILPPRSNYCLALFKKQVASDVVNIINNSGGIDLYDEYVEVFELDEFEELIAWELKRNCSRIPYIYKPTNDIALPTPTTIRSSKKRRKRRNVPRHRNPGVNTNGIGTNSRLPKDLGQCDRTGAKIAALMNKIKIT